ncbi:hypothetical protein AVEN_164924-1 [Araneus ventricosus]|uniref:Uncharacterized protein n=1 Tax=Araneus ventricosus TaxID=182803 RepID=A0A4Y2FUQ9_ARAVE|nr:hypothetical protein AVEN_164924-1 [Araneus ventricosus]
MDWARWATPIANFIDHRLLLMKAIIYETPVDSIEDFVAQLSIADRSVREIPGIFGTVRQSLFRCYQACIIVCDRNCDHLL